MFAFKYYLIKYSIIVGVNYNLIDVNFLNYALIIKNNFNFNFKTKQKIYVYQYRNINLNTYIKGIMSDIRLCIRNIMGVWPQSYANYCIFCEFDILHLPLTLWNNIPYYNNFKYDNIMIIILSLIIPIITTFRIQFSPFNST